MSGQSIQASPSVAEILARIGALDALSDLIAENRAQLRDFLERKAEEVAVSTGSAPSLRVKGVGQAYITAPAERAVVTDDAKFGTWARAAFPGRTDERLEIDARKIADLAEADEEFATLLRDAGALHTGVMWDRELPDELAGEFPRTRGGSLVDPATGEAIDIVVQAVSRPTFVVKIDKPYRERITARLRELPWEPPALPAAFDEERA